MHKTTTHSDDDCRAQHSKQDKGNTHVAAAQPPLGGTCGILDLPGQNNKPERAYISFPATEVTTTAACTSKK